MVQVDETTQGVLNQISEDLSRKGHTISARTAFRSATVTVNISKSAKKRISRALIF